MNFWLVTDWETSNFLNCSMGVKKFDMTHECQNLLLFGLFFPIKPLTITKIGKSTRKVFKKFYEFLSLQCFGPLQLKLAFFMPEKFLFGLISYTKM